MQNSRPVWRFSDAKERQAAEQSLKRKLEGLNQAIGTNGDVENIAIWKKYKPILESVAKQYPSHSVDQASLAQIEAKLIQPLMNDLQEKKTPEE